MIRILWDELYDAKKNEIYITQYLSFLKSVKKILEIATILLTSTGFISWLADKGSVWTGISAGLATTVKLIELIQDKLIANDEYIENVAILGDNWHNYSSELDSLWIDYMVDKVDDKQASEIFKKLKRRKKEVMKTGGRIKVWVFWTVNDSSDEETTNYMKRYLNQ
jgi:hypothetical protein